MNMKNTLLAAAMTLAVTVGRADDQFLYWMVNPYDTEFHTAGRAFDYAYLTVTDQGGMKLTDGSGNAVHLESFVPDGDAMISLGTGVHADGDSTALTTLPVFSSLGDYAGSSYGFVVEAYLDGGLLWTSGVSYYDALIAANSVWNGKGSAMSGNLSAATFMVPEPSSALLLLLGFAGLALRRNKLVNMKQVLLTAMMFGSTLAFGAANDTVLVFSTRGPDTYGDGSTVLDGERYALVWVKAGTEFAGLTSDCKPLAETTKVIAVAPLAKGGRCPETVFEIDADYAETLKGGSFALYLLDTRVSATALCGECGGEGTRRPTAVNSVGQASSAIASTSQLSTSQLSTSVALATVGVYTKIDQPTITGMAVEGAKIELRVDGMSDVAEYMVVQGAEPGKVGEKMATTVKGENLLVVDKPGGSTSFFKVLGMRKFK